MYLLILFLPLIGSFSAGFFGRKLGSSGAQVVTIFSLAGASLLALLAFYEVAICASPVSINLGSWVNSDILTINWLFYFDQLTVSMLVVVSVVSFMIHIYSVYYMTGDPHQQRFFSYLSLFTFFMLLTVSGGNYLVLFLGWEGVGVSSYLLINYFYTRMAANKAAVLAFNQNRVSDMFFSIGLFAMIAVFGSLDFNVIFSLAPSINPNLITIICVLLFIGASAKSAVLFQHNWLPGSMEAKKETTINLKYYIIIFILTCEFIYLFLEYLCKNYLFFILSIIITYLLLINYSAITNTELEFIILQSVINPLLFPLTGTLLGDGHLRYTHKDKNDPSITKGNAHFSMTLKNYEYICFLYYNIYRSIMSPTPPRPWPNPETGKPVQQYTINSLTNSFFSELHSQWYSWCSIENKFIKVLPEGIYELLTPMGLALWIQDDGYYHNGGVRISSDNFTLQEVVKLSIILETKFSLKVTINNKFRANSKKQHSYLIRISAESMDTLRELVLPYFVPSMMYKLGLGETKA